MVCDRGDSIVPDVETIRTANGKHIISKAWDNRYGCVAVIELLESLKDVELPFTLIARCERSRRSWIAWCSSFYAQV